MTAPRDADRLIRTFIDDTGTDTLPDHAFDDVRREIHTTRQRVVIGPWREPRMSNLARYTVLAAAIVVLVGAGVFVLRPSPGGIGATVSPSPGARATQTPGDAIPGRVRLVEGSWAMTVDVPVGWFFDGVLTKNYGRETGPGFALWSILGTFVDPCTDHTLVVPAPTTVDGLVTALANQPGTTAGPITDVTVDGFHGKVVEVTVATDIAKCGENGFWLWASSDVGGARYVQDNEEMNRIYVLDVGSRPFTFFARIPARTTAADRAEVDAMIASIQIEGLTTSPSP
jgi:hypothetical protein